ncbi:hypothetical protein K458DRAFT_130917 [Lentithecium fluviatile CBS 122367]|uniref:CFEM domain-containing protein n=1 Tax=Lentithecium fluviatile CBS 122367 TaxID=1168545 RepID=A0A6G1JGI3_9PLEO|nr:hypothetical protein K458DRAFT_130917 [Lentithecium fluviatile CBS 122367]
MPVPTAVRCYCGVLNRLCVATSLKGGPRHSARLGYLLYILRVHIPETTTDLWIPVSSSSFSITMKGFFLVCALVSLLTLVVPSGAQDNELTLLPSCAKECVNSTLTNPDCHPLSSSDASCACSSAAALTTAKGCFATSCSVKDALSAMNITAVACNEPVRDKSKGYRLINLVFFVLVVIAVACRWMAYGSVGRINWLDEANMIIVLALDIVLFAICHKMSYTGLGEDMWKVPFDRITNTLLWFWITEITYFALIGFVKISFLLFYLQIFPDKRFRHIVWGVIIFNGAAMIAFVFATIFICSPVSLVWKAWDGEHMGKCGNNNHLAFSHAAFSILLDFVALSLPISQIWSLQLSMKKKIGVLLMFGVGAFVTVVSILRLRSLVHFANTTNATWDFLEASLWSIIEWQVGIICCCMPSIRLGLARLFPKILGSTAQSTSKPTYGGTGPIRSDGHPLSANAINVQTTFRVSHMRKPQTNDDERSFVQLVEIDASDAKSAAGSQRS